ARPELGQHDRRRRVRDLQRAVDHNLSWPRYRFGCDVAQRHRRRTAGRPRSARGAGMKGPALLRVRDLKTYFVTEHGTGTARAVDDVSFDLYPGETLGIVGESGCGKTVTSLSILRLVPEPRSVRGNQIAMIFQEPMTSLNPVFTVGDQIAEAAIIHQHLSRGAARAK